jgi:hypothetical protein
MRLGIGGGQAERAQRVADIGAEEALFDAE